MGGKRRVFVGMHGPHRIPRLVATCGEAAASTDTPAARPQS
jgi:hypothetical protein